MTTRTKAPSAATYAGGPPWGWRYQPPPITADQCLQDIELLLRRVTHYCEFMSQAETLQGTSRDAKEKAVIAFHERMVVLERQLGRIHEELRLG